MQQEQEELLAQIAESQAEDESVKRKNQELEEQKHELEERNQHLQQQSQELEERNQQLKSENQQLKSENQQLKSENQQLKSENQQLKERNQELIQQLNNVVVPAVPNYEDVRSRILKSMTTGKGSFASTSPQYKFASRALDKFIEAINPVLGDIAPSTRTSTKAKNTPDSQE